MLTCFVRESMRMPAVHPRREDGDDINSSAFHRNITANLLETFTPEHLSRAGNVIRAAEPVVIDLSVFTKRSSAHAKFWIFRKFPQQKRIVIFRKGKVGIQIADEVKVKMLCACIGGVKTTRLAAKIPRL